MTLTTLLACQERPNSNKDDVILKSYMLIDAQRTDEAIELLTGELSVHPDDYDLKVTLASAYAHKGGFKIQTLTPLLATIRSNQMTFDLTSGDSLTNVISYLRSLSMILTIYAQIPTIQKDNVDYLNFSISLLENLNPKVIKPAELVYRNVLRALLLKTILMYEITDAQFGKLDKNSKCTVDLEKLEEPLQKSLRVVQKMVADQQLLKPDRASALQAQQKSLAEFSGDLTNAVSSLILLDDTMKTALKASIIQLGFGTFLRCQDSQPSADSI